MADHVDQSNPVIQPDLQQQGSPHPDANVGVSQQVEVRTLNVGDILVDDQGQQMILRPLDDVPTKEIMKQIAVDTVGPVADLVKKL